MLVFVEAGWKTGELREKPSKRDENQQQTQHTSDRRRVQIRTRATFVGGDRSHHCAMPASAFRLSECVVS